jgi:hypothetical protein
MLFAGAAMGIYAQPSSPNLGEGFFRADDEYAQDAGRFENGMRGKFAELSQELRREDRLASEEAARIASERVNTILRDLGQLYGDATKARVGFFIKAKNALTPEQRQHLLTQLQPKASFPYESIDYMRPEVFDLPLNLTRNQRKRLIELEAELLVKEVRLERDIALVLVDLEELLLSSEPRPDEADALAMKLAGFAAQAIENRIDFFIAAKDMLSLDQKRMLTYLMELD